MACYSVVWRTSAERELRKLPREAIARVIALAAALASDPYPAGAEHTWRIRTGDYRLIYSVAGDVLMVEIVKVGHRRDVNR